MGGGEVLSGEPRGGITVLIKEAPESPPAHAGAGGHGRLVDDQGGVLATQGTRRPLGLALPAGP